MTISYNNNIPDAPNNPSNDQPLMKTNTNAIDSILQVDHYSFNTTNFSGNHLQIHLGQFTNPAIVNAAAAEGSVVYSKAGTTDTAHAQLFFKNANGVDFLLSAVRAFGSFLMSNGNTTKINGENFTFLVTGNSAVVTLTNNATDGSTNFVVISNVTQGVISATPGYALAANKITFLVPNVFIPPTATGILSFIVLQI